MEDRPLFDLPANAVERQVRAAEDPAGHTFTLAQETEQQMLGFNRDASELAGFVACEKQDPPRAFAVAFEHNVGPPEGGHYDGR